jgi:hypothetical protein
MTDDDGNVRMFKKEYIGDEGQWINVNWYREYSSQIAPDDSLSDVALGCWFNNVEQSIYAQETKYEESTEQCLYMFTIFSKCKANRVVVDDFFPCHENVPVYCKNKSGALWQGLLQKAMAKYYGGMSYNCYNHFPQFWYCFRKSYKNAAVFLNNIIKAPAVEYPLCKFEQHPRFNEILEYSYPKSMILCTWRPENVCYNKRYEPKCFWKDEGMDKLIEGGFKFGHYQLVSSVNYTAEDGTPKRVCVLRGPGGLGNELRDKKWNLEQFPDMPEDAKDKLYPMWGDFEDLFYMEW